MAIAKLSQSANAKHSKSEAGKTEKGGGEGRGWNILALYGGSWVGIWEFSWKNMGY